MSCRTSCPTESSPMTLGRREFLSPTFLPRGDRGGVRYSSESKARGDLQGRGATERSHLSVIWGRAEMSAGGVALSIIGTVGGTAGGVGATYTAVRANSIERYKSELQ